MNSAPILAMIFLKVFNSICSDETWWWEQWKHKTGKKK